MQNPGFASTRYMDGSGAAIIASLVLVDSLHFVFARALIPYLHPAVSSMYLMAIGCAVVGVYTLARGHLSPTIWLQHIGFFFAIGLLVGGSTVLTFAAMQFIDPGTGSMLAKLSVVLSIGLGILWLGERMTVRQAAGALMSMCGVAIITFQPGEYLRLGSMMIVAATVMYALHTAIVKRYGGGIDFLNFFFMRLLATTIVLAAFVALTPQARSSIWPTGQAWMILLAAGIIDVAISRGLYYVALRRLPMSIHAVILTLSPAATILWSWALFGAYPLPWQLAGGVLVLAGVLTAMLVPEPTTR